MSAYAAQLTRAVSRTLLFACALNAAIAIGTARAQDMAAFEPGSLEQITARHQGQPFIVMLWSMDCEFCQASLELLSKLRHAHPELQVVTISTDPLADAGLAAQSAQRLASLGLGQDAWSFGATAPERLRYAIDPRWHGEKPRTYWYDRAGRRTAHSGVLTEAMIHNWLAAP